MVKRLGRILVTGARGFIGQNLAIRLSEIEGIHVVNFNRGDDPDVLPALIAEVDAVVHLAGENRPTDTRAFEAVNAELTRAVCAAIHETYRAQSRHVPLILASSRQAERDTPYGLSKRAAEEAVLALSSKTGNPCTVFRLPGVFGKWCRPNYNSVVATYCHNIARGLAIRIDDPDATLRLVYIDDVLDAFLTALAASEPGFRFATVEKEYAITLGALAEQIQTFHRGREILRSERVGSGLPRALYATYLTYLPPERFIYNIASHSDHRGVFVEMLKTPESGQFSYFTAHPGVTRGGHYHHTKTEKFLVIKGEALFRFRHLLSDELVELRTCGETPQVVDTIPGWAHDITNVGDDEMVVMLWANEIFEREKPDTVASKV